MSWLKLFKQNLSSQNYTLIANNMHKYQTLEDKVEELNLALSNEQNFTTKYIAQALLQRESNKHKYLSIQYIPENIIEICHQCKILCNQFIQLHPCQHLICQQCVQGLQEKFVSCPVCLVKLSDISINEHLSQRILKSNCKCPNNNITLASVPQYEQIEITLFNLDEYQMYYKNLSEETLVFLSRFNSNHYSYKVLNFIRQCYTVDKSHQFYREIINQIKSDKQLVEVKLIHNQLFTQKKISIKDCTYTSEYKNMSQHLKGECQQYIQQCTNVGCRESYPKKAMQDHMQQCLFKPTFCPICFRTDVQQVNLSQHVIDCLKNLESAQNNYDSQPECMNNVPDIALEYKVRKLQSELETYGELSIKYFIKVQREIVKKFREQNMNPIVELKSARTFLSPIYEDRVIPMTITFQLLCLMFYGGLKHLFVDNFKLTVGLVIVEFVNIFLMMVHWLFHINKCMYRSFLYIQAFTAVISFTLNFTGLYTYLQLCDDQSFSGTRKLDVYDVLLDMLYFSTMLTSTVNLGDIHPVSLWSKIFATVHIFVNMFCIYMIFRGSSFYFRTKNMQRKLKEIEVQKQQVTDLLKSR
ncbi:Transmembrane_domain-containing protein [Hexamita inflata]|uniref:Transmembrane_domain-containing protein n=1 Tax=Hexamita inflata TaxID=28002 RepID=A0ABP1L2G3_9EUKA